MTSTAAVEPAWPVPEHLDDIWMACTRFNDATWAENVAFKVRKNLPDDACIFGCPRPIPEKVTYQGWMFVCEMNNDHDKIIGISALRNRRRDSKFNIYGCGNYNRCIYRGVARMSRDELIEAGAHAAKIVESLEKILFKGRGHSKRGQGITAIPLKKLHALSELRLQKSLWKLFQTKYRDRLPLPVESPMVP